MATKLRAIQSQLQITL